MVMCNVLQVQFAMMTKFITTLSMVRIIYCVTRNEKNVTIDRPVPAKERTRE